MKRISATRASFTGENWLRDMRRYPTTFPESEKASGAKEVTNVVSFVKKPFICVAAECVRID